MPKYHSNMTTEQFHMEVSISAAVEGGYSPEAAERKLWGLLDRAKGEQVFEIRSLIEWCRRGMPSED